jgi:hypothetical protein
MADDAAPYRGTPSTTDRKPKVGRPPKKATNLLPIPVIRERLKVTITQVGILVSAKDATDGLIIVGAGPDMVDAYCDLAETNSLVHKALHGLASAKDSLGVITATAIPTMAILKNHGYYNGPLLVSIATLEQRARDGQPDLDIDDPLSVDLDLDPDA